MINQLVDAAATGIARPILQFVARQRQLMSVGSTFARDKLASCRSKLDSGESVLVMGIGCAGHNAGAGLVQASNQGIQIISNHEEERFRGIKHCKAFPYWSIKAIRDDLANSGLGLEDLDAVVATWDYVELGANMVGHMLSHFPAGLAFLREDASPTFSLRDFCSAFHAPTQFGKQFGARGAVPIIALRHHDNHAFMSLCVSPFADSSETTLVAVIDGLGDDTPISLYRHQSGRLTRFYKSDRLFDSIGQMYLYLSSTQGGWPALSSEGRYMGAAAWGNGDRMTNPYYRPLRDLFQFGPQGKVRLNQDLANWHRSGSLNPDRKRLAEILGDPIPPDQTWNPDQVLCVEDVRHAPITRDRLDKAAATQMLFEDAVFHIFEHGLRHTGASQAVFAGGAALNCVASARLLQHFDESWYERYLDRKQTRLHLWVPPTPGDAGAPVGAAYHFACLAGAWPQASQSPMNPFLCGSAPTQAEIQQAISSEPEIDACRLGNQEAPLGLEQIADLMAYIVSRDGIIGIVQGAAETGPRALGHRSILANPTNPSTLRLLNARVKFRERIRPLAPMATLTAAQRLFQLAEGASDRDYDAYSYMVLTAEAKPEARRLIPAVVHHDGSCRVQIVRRELDPLMHSYLRAMGRRTGFEVSVNTSLNVGSPIVQSPQQALQTVKKSRGLHGVFLVAEDGSCYVAWHNVHTETKDGGQQIQRWIRQWQEEQVADAVHTASPKTQPAERPTRECYVPKALGVNDRFNGIRERQLHQIVWIPAKR